MVYAQFWHVLIPLDPRFTLIWVSKRSKDWKAYSPVPTKDYQVARN